MPPLRPSALEVSFPDELLEEPEAHQAQAPAPARSGPSTSTVRVEKRKKVDSIVDARAPKRRQSALDKENQGKATAVYYRERPDETPEAQAGCLLDDDADESREEDDSKPIRLLNHFVIFDPRHKCELVSLGEIEKHDPMLDREFEGAGEVKPFSENDEDEGQDEDLEDGDAGQTVRLRLSAILRYWTDYTQDDAAIWIETLYAWYILDQPAKTYRNIYDRFYKPIRVARFVISTLVADKKQTSVDKGGRMMTLDELKVALCKESLFERPLTEEDLWQAVPEMMAALDGLDPEDLELLESHPVMGNLSPKGPRVSKSRTSSRGRVAFARNAAPRWIGNPDLAVLRKDTQARTHVTPRIYEYTRGYFQEHLKVVGAQPSPRPSPPREAMRNRLLTLLAKSSERRKIKLRREHRKGAYYAEIEVDGITYRPGDCILILAGPDGKIPAPKIPSDLGKVPKEKSLEDFFWFAKLLFISVEHETAHVQWFVASSRTAMGDICDPQELFILDLCENRGLDEICGKVKVHDFSSRARTAVPYLDFYCKSAYDPALAVYQDIKTTIVDAFDPTSQCPVCPSVAQLQHQQTASKLGSTGIAWHGNKYHCHDFVKLKATSGPCQLAQIQTIQLPRNSEATMVVKLLGRVAALTILPANKQKDEREVFITDEEVQVTLGELISPCKVLHRDSLKDRQTWLLRSPNHFYSCYRFPSLCPKSWDERISISFRDISQCSSCVNDHKCDLDLEDQFLHKSRRLRTFDPFAGVGAFGRGLENAGCVDVTHSIEISPSASETLRRNSSKPVVYNQCANKVLEYAIKSHEGHAGVNVLTSLFNTKEALPPPPKPGDIDCIIVGFPCQPHSALNMYKSVHDRKSNLVLNVLSWVDFLKPTYCIFENVRGFLSFRLNAKQAGPHRIEGGIDQGGLKFLLRVMVDLDYQVRFGLLEAGRYGAPQTRVRFFMVAVKHGHTLPEFPQPSHEFPVADSLQISLSNGNSIEPIRTMTGTAPHQFVTIGDAIGDLALFDWKNPGKFVAQTESRISDDVPEVECDNARPHSGLLDLIEYRHKPMTAFQQQCRTQEAIELQHFTRTYRKATVERVINIPLRADADYRSLRPELWEWQTSNPASAMGKQGFRKGLYGRLDKDGWFPTTVTNMTPTAKQSRVLHPYCRRVLTVRELARSQGFPDNFSFFAINDNVTTMHRQIGNAVPLNLGYALGLELRAALFKDWQTKQEEVRIKQQEAIIID